MANKVYIDDPGYQVIIQDEKFYCFLLDDDGEKVDILGSALTFDDAIVICEEALDEFYKKGYYE